MTSRPLDVLLRVQELVDLGETISSIRKVVKLKKSDVSSEAVAPVLERLHRAYGFRPEVYRFVGIGEDALARAGVLGGDGREGRDAKTPKKKRGA